MDFIIKYWNIILEIIILWYIFYAVLVFIQGSRIIQVVKGLLLLILLFLLSEALDLGTIKWMLSKLVTIWVIAFLIIFHPELRRGLARLGQFGFYMQEEKVVDEIVKAAINLSMKKFGALIAVEREIGLKPYIESGIIIDGKVTNELLINIFTPLTPLHDGGVIIENDRIIAASCLYPLAQEAKISKSFGTRHRAAIGLSEETDAIVIVVSEETGAISIAAGGELSHNIAKEALQEEILKYYKPKKKI